MAEVVDCAERMIQFKQRCPGAEFDLKPNMFTARIPGHAEPFRAMSLCSLMNTVERWAAEQTVARLLFGADQPSAPTWVNLVRKSALSWANLVRT
jgi:hypothetical protein